MRSQPPELCKPVPRMSSRNRSFFLLLLSGSWPLICCSLPRIHRRWFRSEMPSADKSPFPIHYAEVGFASNSKLFFFSFPQWRGGGDIVINCWSLESDKNAYASFDPALIVEKKIACMLREHIPVCLSPLRPTLQISTTHTSSDAVLDHDQQR